MAVGLTPNLSQLISQQLEKPATLPPPVGPGSKPEAVHGVQEMLKQLGHKLDPKEDRADTYGSSTQAAVTSFQKSMHLPETGVADLTTQGKMREMVELLEQRQKDVFQLLASLNKL